jgi:hypothetical protein
MGCLSQEFHPGGSRGSNEKGLWDYLRRGSYKALSPSLGAGALSMIPEKRRTLELLQESRVRVDGETPSWRVSNA